jgi:thioredoxin-like negative regulator of GroEL
VNTDPVARPTSPQGAEERPRLVFFYGRTSGPSRRVEGFLSQVLQRRKNHDTFRLIRVCAETSPELVTHFQVETIPAIVVIEGRRVRAHVEDPRHCNLIEEALAPWLR